MKIYHLKQKQFLPITLTEAWSFFSDPRNLESITPPRLKFQIVNVSMDRDVYEGQVIHYRIQILPLVWVTWLTEITKVKNMEYFIDDQRLGPYSLWHHQHHFREVRGGVEMSDAVTYALPLGWLGRIAHALFVRAELLSIFLHRRQVLERRFSRSEGTIIVNEQL